MKSKAEPPKGKEVKPSGKQTPIDKTKPGATGAGAGAGAKPKTPTDIKAAQAKNAKGAPNTKGGKQQQVIEPEEDLSLPPPEKEKNLERFIYVSVYSDTELMKKLKDLFEQINQPAFQLRSVKEIYTKSLTPEEQDNNEINYISGCQLIDKELRITIIEGITGQAMLKVKETLPKTQMNSATYKVFADSRVLFNKRIYSKFDLNLKYIKLRDTLSTILTTHDIYSKANKYKEIYNAFLNYGSIMKAITMLEIAEANLFPNANDLLLLERKYADILNDEDLTGVKIPPKVKKRIRTDSLLDKTVGLNNSVQSMDSNTMKSYSVKQKSVIAGEVNQSQGQANQGQAQGQGNDKEKYDRKLMYNNAQYDGQLQTRQKKSFNETMRDNFDYLNTMKKKPHQNHFCRPYDDVNDEQIYLYSNSRKNFYEQYFDTLREKYKNDTKSYYTYSLDALTLSYPMVADKNHEYLAYVENKKKWTAKEDFSRWEQPKREYIYFPKINNVL